MHKQDGFTLAELLTVITIIGILAGVGIPAYNDYVTRSKIAEATSALSEGRIKMEQFFQDNRTYPTGCVIAPAAPGATQVQLPALQAFDLACDNLGATTYTVTATGKDAMAGFTYTINEQNVKTSAFSGTGASAGWTAATPNTCWVFRKGGQC